MPDKKHIGFEALAKKVAENYKGKKVKPKYQKEYGKTYSKEEAEEVGNKVAGKMKAQMMGEGGEISTKGWAKINDTLWDRDEIMVVDESKFGGKSEFSVENNSTKEVKAFKDKKEAYKYAVEKSSMPDGTKILFLYLLGYDKESFKIHKSNEMGEKSTFESFKKLMDKVLETSNMFDIKKTFAEGGDIKSKKIKLIVVDENTLAYINPSTPNKFSVLNALITKGSNFNNLQTYSLSQADTYRLASKKDFDDLRVDFEGYENDDEYEYDKKDSYASGGDIKSDYKIVDGFDHYRNRPLYQVVYVGDNEDIEYDGEWHTDREDAEKELKGLTETYAEGGEIEKTKTAIAKLEKIAYSTSPMIPDYTKEDAKAKIKILEAKLHESKEIKSEEKFERSKLNPYRSKKDKIKVGDLVKVDFIPTKMGVVVKIDGSKYYIRTRFKDQTGLNFKTHIVKKSDIDVVPMAFIPSYISEAYEGVFDEDSKSEEKPKESKSITKEELVSEFEKRGEGKFSKQSVKDFKSDADKYTTAINYILDKGFTKEEAFDIYLGFAPKCDAEFELTGHLYDYTLEGVKRYIDMISEAKEKGVFEAGFKYLQFAKGELEKLGLKSIGLIEFDDTNYKGEKTISKRECYVSDSCKTIMFFEEDRVGDGGYSGLYSFDEKEGVKIIKGLLDNPKNYVKDIDVYYNNKIYMDEKLIEETLKKCAKKEEPKPKTRAKKEVSFNKTLKFRKGDLVYNVSEKEYGIVLDNYGDSEDGNRGEIRLDSSGNTSIFKYNKDYSKEIGYNLVPFGSKEDVGKESLDSIKKKSKMVIDSVSDKKDKERYEDIYNKLLSGYYDRFKTKSDTRAKKEPKETAPKEKASKFDYLIERLKKKPEYKGKLENKDIDKGHKRDLKKDLDRTAKKPGKRISKDGEIYYESRENRSDVNGKNRL